MKKDATTIERRPSRSLKGVTFPPKTSPAEVRVLRYNFGKRGKYIIAVAEGEQKHEAILGALHGQLFNVLVTEPLTAAYAINES